MQAQKAMPEYWKERLLQSDEDRRRAQWGNVAGLISGLYKKDYNFEIGKGILLKNGKDIAIFATGTMVHECIEASKILEAQNISSKVINIHTIKPFDSKLVENVSKEVKLIVTVEEHSIVGGLGTCVAEAKSKIKNSPPQFSIGMPQEFGKSENYKDMLKSYNLTSSQIAQNILSQLKNV